MGDIDFLSDFCPAENPINSQKTRFWKEKSVENVVTFAGLPLTLGPTEQATLVETDRRPTLPKLELESQFSC